MLLKEIVNIIFGSDVHSYISYVLFITISLAHFDVGMLMRIVVIGIIC